MLETLKLSKTLKSSRDDFNVLDNFNVSSIKKANSSWFGSIFMLFLYLHYIALFTKIHTWKLFAYGKISWKNKNRKKSLVKKGKKERKKQQKERKYHSVKKKNPLWKQIVQAELHAGVQISNKEVAVKQKFAGHNVENEVSFSLCKYQP